MKCGAIYPLLFGTAIFGIATGPMVWAVGEGLSGAIVEAKPDNARPTARRLYSAYRDVVPEPLAMNTMIAAASCGLGKEVPSVVMEQVVDPWEAGPWNGGQGFRDLQYAETAMEVPLRTSSRLEAINARTTGFGRSFLSSCLRTPVYRNLCRSTAGKVIADAEEAIGPPVARIRDSIAQRYAKTRCVYLDGLRHGKVEIPVVRQAD